jgi:hypothetical protein
MMPIPRLPILAAFSLAILPVARADQAVVVGVEQYAPLVAASTLKGCLNDAQGIAEAFRQMKFKVILLTNSLATRQNILDAFKEIQKTIKKDERFVFYFAGHGRKAPRFALMPSDATISGNDIEPKDLNDAILKITAKSRTVLLDSCFSGGMAAGEMSRGADDFEPRFFDPVEERSIRFGPAKAQGSSSNKPDKLETAPGICYYTASLDSEQALEATMDDGKRHGLFTYGLLKNLKTGKLWSVVHNDVKKQIGKRLENSGRTQNPMISTAYMPTDALDNSKKATPAPPPGKTLLDMWNLDNPNPEMISLKIKPDLDIQEVGRQVSLEIKNGKDGFLVILGQVGNRFYQFYPYGSTQAVDARVRKGTITFPSAQERLFFDTFGADHLKAMLFETPEKAEALMAAMQAAGGQAKDIPLQKDVKDSPYTSRISIAVSNFLIGGSKVKEINSFVKRVMAGEDGPSKFIVSQLKLAAANYQKGETWLATFDPSTAQTSITDQEAFVCLLNLAIQAGVLYETNAFAGVKLSDALKKAIAKPPTGEKLWKLNRDILLALYPGEVNPDDPRK